MRNRDKWRPTKYVYRNGKLIGSRNGNDLWVSSRLITDIIAEFYDNNLRQHAKGRLLDLGCGQVPLFISYQNYIRDNICVDWENTLHKNALLDLECDLTKSLPFEDGEFDTIILSDVLEHIPEPAGLWKEMARMLSINGKIIMNVPFYYCLHEHPHDYYRYTEFALRRFVENSGLRLVELSPIGGVPEIMADIFAKNILRLPKIGFSLALFAHWFTSVFIKTKLGKKISDATKGNFPFGYFLVAEKPLVPA